MGEALGIALIGCGAFGEFCLEALADVAEVRVAAVADSVPAAAARLAEKFGVPACGVEELLARSDVELVHVATPPASHYELALVALRARKSVLCEKPLATTLSHANIMLGAAEAAGAILPVDFVLRYNAVTDAVKAVIDSGVLGAVLAGRLTNCAGDTKLGPDHWFWDKAVSGGIFVEHGVHFFNLYTHWLGPSRVLSAHAETRAGAAMEDRVTCTVRHDNGAVVSHYHGFDQLAPMDRTDHRLVCELGDIHVHGWIPLKLELDAAVSDEGAARLGAFCPGCEVEELGRIEGELRGRGVARDVTKRIRLTWQPVADKQAAYADSFRALVRDQAARIRDRSHARRVTEGDGRTSLELAVAAAELAERR